MTRSHLRLRAASACLVVTCLLSACSGTTPTLPPLEGAEGAPRLPGKFVWHNLVTADAEGARRFYGALFGWEFELVADGRYTVISLDGRNVGGIIDASRDGAAPRAAHWISAISVSDVRAATKAIKKAGGKQLEAPITVPGIGTVVTVQDADGARFHLLASADGDPPDSDPAVHDWLWHELLAADPERAAVFYQEVFDYRIESLARKDQDTYRVLWGSGGARAGVIDNPFESDRSAWIPYVRVADPRSLAARAEQLGGTVLVEPRPEIRKGTLALVLDPSGAPVALQQWTPGKEVEP